MRNILVVLILLFTPLLSKAAGNPNVTFFKNGHKYPISIIHNLKNGKDYTPESVGFGGEDVWIFLNSDGTKLTLHQSISKVIFKEGETLSQTDDIAECEYRLSDFSTGTVNGNYAEECKITTESGSPGNILATKMGVNNGKNIYGFHIHDGIFDDLLWCFYMDNVTNEVRDDFENLNGLEIKWKNGISDSTKNIVREIVRNMVRIKPGSFLMGSSNPNAEDCEKPVHRVNLSEYYINKYPVTEKEVKAILNINIENPNGDNYPMVNLTRNDCWDICTILEDLTGLKFTIPTEAQWEYAARGGSDYEFSGSADIGLVGWYEDNSYGKIHPVGKKDPNGYGLYDMTGNVHEWCSDYHYKNYTSDVQTDPLIRIRREDGFAPYCIMRGGSYRNSSDWCRVTHRCWDKAYRSGDDIGFRLVIFDIDKLNIIE